MILAAAQTKPVRGDIKANLLDHYRLVELASKNGAHLIVFPELSISGYERENASDLAFTIDDSRLDHLKKLATENQIIIIAGAPIRVNDDLYIGGFIIHPNSPVAIYTKQYLHPGEEVYYQPSFDYNPIIEIDNEKISLAICADIDNPQHPEDAKKNKTTIYIPSIFFSPNGINQAHDSLRNYAKKHKMDILMSNFSGDSWGAPSGGRSAFWSTDGKLIAEMDDTNSGLLLIEKKNNSWIPQLLNDN